MKRGSTSVCKRRSTRTLHRTWVFILRRNPPCPPPPRPQPRTGAIRNPLAIAENPRGGNSVLNPLRNTNQRRKLPMGLRAATAVCTSRAQENCTEPSPPPPPQQPLVPPTCTAVPCLPETRRRAHGQGPTAEGEWKLGPRRALCPLQQECTRRRPLMSLSVIVHRPGKTGPGAIFSLRAGPWDRRSASAWAQRPWLTGQRIGRPPLQSSEPSPVTTACT